MARADAGHGQGRAGDVRTPEVEDLVVDYRRGGMSWRQIAGQVTLRMRERYLVAHNADRDLAADQGREPIPARQDFVVSHEGCRKAFKRVMMRNISRTSETAQELRELELQRLDMLQMALTPRAVGTPKTATQEARGPDVAAVRAIVQIMKLRAFLTGIGADAIGAVGEEGAEVRFGVYTPEEIAKKKKEIAAGGSL